MGRSSKNPERATGILLTPFIHADFKHLFSNSVPCWLWVLEFLTSIVPALQGFHNNLDCKRNMSLDRRKALYHIGASGIVYGLASFLFSGIIRRDIRLAAISLVVVFLYGGMIWGIFPIWPTISWEGHLFGGLTGFACALAYRKHGPQPKVYSWEIEEEEEMEKEEEGNRSDYHITIS